MSSKSLRKPKTAKGRRIERGRAPKIVEEDKSAIFLKTTTASQKISQVLNDICVMKKPHSKLLTHRNPIHPFEDANSLEFLTKVNDASLFMVGSHSKKRPHALTIGRTFDAQILDMLEVTIDPNTFKSIQDLSSQRKTIARLGSKPMLLFTGDIFTTDDDLITFKSLMMDFFHIKNATKINLAGLDRIIQFTCAVDPSDITKKAISMRHYTVQKKKSGTKLPRVVLEEIGPRIDMGFSRKISASAEIRKASMRVHKAARNKLSKNVEVGQMGQLLGRIHMEKQDFDQIALKKNKSLGSSKRSRVIAPLNNINYKKASGNGDDDGDLSDDFDKVDMQSSKRQKTLPKAYMNSIISE